MKYIISTEKLTLLTGIDHQDLLFTLCEMHSINPDELEILWKAPFVLKLTEIDLLSLRDTGVFDNEQWYAVEKHLLRKKQKSRKKRKLERIVSKTRTLNDQDYRLGIIAEMALIRNRLTKIEGKLGVDQCEN